jgi:proteasome activator subunit 2 (PA28 beta)
MSSSTSTSHKKQKIAAAAGPLSPSSTARLQTDANKKMDLFRNEAEERAIGLLETFLPLKVRSLGQIIKEHPAFNLTGSTHFDPGELPYHSATSSVTSSAAGSKKKKRKREASKDDKDDLSSSSEDSDSDAPVIGVSGSDRIVPSNVAVQKCIAFLKQESHEGVQALSAIKLWIQLLVPRIEDGNNFGVEVQEECSGEIERVETQIFSLSQTSAKYFRERAKLAEHWSKHPNIRDFRQALIERDQLEYFQLKLFLRDMHANFATLLDLICKNLKVILKPKGEDDAASGRNMMMM